MHAVIPYVTAALLFGLGVYGVLRRRNAILVLMAVELMLNAVNLIFVTADVTLHGNGYGGGVFALFVIVLAAAEVGVGLAIVLQYYRMRHAVALDEVQLDAAGGEDAAGEDAAEDDATPGGSEPDGERVAG